MALIEIEALNFAYPGEKRMALSDVRLSVEEGEFVLVAGPSGCGKSTFLRMLKPALTPHGRRSGSIYYAGKPIGELDHRRQTAEIGFVMQDPEMQIATDKVWHELAFGLESLGTDRRTMRVRVAEMANFFGIESWFDSPVSKLSGGQKQLLCLASVMVMRPKLLLLDEPTSQLDPIAASEFFDTLGRINRELGTTVIITEHRTEALFPAVDKVVFMREGRIAYSGTPRGAAELFSREPELAPVLPTAMTVFASLRENGEPFGSAPLTVREGRKYLSGKLASRELPVRNVREDGSEKKKGAERTARGSLNDAPVISMRGVWFRYEKNSPDILKGCDMDIRRGELTCIVGGNGAGKTTAVLNASGMYKPYRGKVLLGGKSIFAVPEAERYGRHISVLMQNPLLGFTADSILEELHSVQKRFKLSDERVGEIIRLMEIEPILGSNPYDISGGELQRAAIAKLLLPSPEVLFLDEATKGMDAFFKLKFGRLLQKLCSLGTAVVLVSHDIEFCAEFADRLLMFANGGVIAEGAPRAVLSGNSFYTTAAARMADGLIDGAITAKDIKAAFGR